MSPTAKAEPITDAVKEAANESAEDLRRQLEALRADLAQISGTLAGIGQHKGEAVADALRDGASKLYAAGEEKADQMAHAASDFYSECTGLLRRKPGAALGIAVGLGLVAGLLLARR